MKIAMIGHKRIPSREGGVEIVVEELSSRLVKMGHTVTVYNRKGRNVADKNADKEKQKLKEYKGLITRNEVEYGIMQVPSFVKISDEESIRQTIDDLENRLKGITKEKDVLDKALESYKDKEEIINIYNEIIEFQHK